jgi:hypothetical protein
MEEIGEIAEILRSGCGRRRRQVNIPADAFRGVRCWHVSAGASTASSFMLVFGDKIRRDRPLRNPSQPEAFRIHKGSVQLLVWCSWRLQNASSVLASSDQGPGWVEQLQELIGQTVTDLVCLPPGTFGSCFPEGRSYLSSVTTPTWNRPSRRIGNSTCRDG